MFNEVEAVVPVRMLENNPPHASSSFDQILPILSFSNIEYFEISKSSIFPFVSFALNVEVEGIDGPWDEEVGGPGAIGLNCPNARRSSKRSFRFDTLLD